MNALLDPIMQSPQALRYSEELRRALAREARERRRFYNEVREDQKAEFINGRVVVHSPVTLQHNLVSGRIHRLLATYAQVRSLGTVGHEKLMVRLSRNDYEPDIVYFGLAKTAGLEPLQRAFPAPDLVVEVLSPSTEANDRGVKLTDYAAHGVLEYWIVDPDGETIEQYLLEDGRYDLALKLRDGRIESRAVEGFVMPVRALFDDDETVAALRDVLGLTTSG